MRRNKKRKPGIFFLAAICIAGFGFLSQRLTGPEQLPIWNILVESIQRCEAALPIFSDSTESIPAAVAESSVESAAIRLDDGSTVCADAASLSQSDAAIITALEKRGDQEILTGGNHEIIYYNQSDPQWTGQPYGTDDIGKYGCGPAVMAMAVSSLTGQAMDPAQMAQWAVDNGLWARRSGSYLSIVENTAAAFGISAESCPSCDAAQLRLKLSGGNVGIALMGPGHFTQGNHFVLLRGTTLEGGILVADSNSRERSVSLWDPQLLLNELSSSHGSGAPLWFLSLPGNIG